MNEHSLFELLREMLAELRAIRERLPEPEIRHAGPLSCATAHHPLAEWLGARGFFVKHCRPSPLVEGIYDQVSLIFGREYPLHEPLIRALRSAISRNTSATIDLSEIDAPARQTLLETCQMLEERGLVADYHHVEENDSAVLVPELLPDLVAFLSGGWLERFLLLEWRRLHDDLSWRDFLANAVIEAADGAVYELDLLAADAEAPRIFECKVGRLGNAPERLAELAENLGLPLDHVVFVLPDHTPESDALPDQFGFRVCSSPRDIENLAVTSSSVR